MRKLICLSVFFTVLHACSQSTGSPMFDPSVIPIEGESVAAINVLRKIEPASTSIPFSIISGRIAFRINGLIDRSLSSPIVINLVATELVHDKLLILVSSGDKKIPYSIDGFGSGLYHGQFNENGFYLTFTRFKINATGYPSYLVDLPVYVYISPEGVIGFGRSFIQGKAFLYTANQKMKTHK